MNLKPYPMLAAASEVAASIVTINISQSKIGVEGGQAIVEALKTTTLESIVIGNDLTLQLKGEPLLSRPLVALESVPSGSWFGGLADSVRLWLR